MAPTQFLKPEIAHAKAKELIDVGKKPTALEILYEMMKFRRARSWQNTLEEPMLLFVDLCIELKKNQHFKRIIHQYRNISIQECPQSLEDVLKHYYGLIKGKTDEARQKSQDTVPDVEDLESPETPESLMLNAMSAEGAQGRSDHTILMPWLKFQWEAYRIGLDLVRNNSKFEHVYHRIARDAFDFCVEYRRRTEFRKLSEMLRMHTTRIQTQPAIQNAISLTNSDTQILHFETRLRQLNCAMDLELFNEAFKIIEDIWSLFLITKKIERPSLMADYYTKAAELFLRSGYYLFHAAALYKRLTLYREHRRAPKPEELTSLGSIALCAALSIPLPHSKNQSSLLSGDNNQAKQKSLANLLGLATVPTRSSLLADLSTGRIQQFVPPELALLYQTLEVDFQPLTLTERVKPAIDKIKENSSLSVYLEPLQEVIVSKTLLQMSKVYRSLHFSQLIKMCPFYEPLALERCVIELVYNLDLPMRVDHRRQAIIFDVYTDLGISQKDYTYAVGLPMQTQADSTDLLSGQLALFAQSLQQVSELLGLNESANSTRDVAVVEYRRIAQEHHRALLSRRYFIENRKEQLEKLQEERTKSIKLEEQRIAEEKTLQLSQEKELLKKEELERERMKSEEEQTRLRRKVARERLTMIMRSEEGSKATLKDITEEQLDQFDAESMVEKKFAEVTKKRRDLMEKANLRAKKLDHLTRAMRLEEIPLLKDAAIKEQLERIELHERAQLELEDQSRSEHEQKLKNRSQLVRIKTDVAIVMKELKDKASSQYKQQYADWEKLCKKVRNERIAERNAKLEAERLAAEAVERELREEAERVERLKMEAQKAELARKEAAEAAARAAAEAKAEEEQRKRVLESEAAVKRESKPYVPVSMRGAGFSSDIGGDMGLPSAGRFKGSRQSQPTTAYERKPPSAFPERRPPQVNEGAPWTRKQVVKRSTVDGIADAQSKPKKDDGEWKAAR